MTLGLHHEQQHQELLLTDIKHVLSCNPLKPAMDPDLAAPPAGSAAEPGWIAGATGIAQIGSDGVSGLAYDDFAFDNETPRHDVVLRPHALADRLVTNAEYRQFVRDGGYSEPALWLSDGWSTVNEQGWQRPLYWSEDLEQEFTLAGLRPLDVHAPVTHVSYYEADAFARWAGARLPTEAEWETAAVGQDTDGNFMESGYWQPVGGDGAQFFA